jgi:hypothetical protein
MNYKVLIAAALAATVVQARDVDPSLPQPWFKNGQPPAAEKCATGVDAEIETRGTPNLTVKCDAPYEGFVGIMQNFAADKYRGQRVRFSALVKSEGVEDWGGLWMRVDDVDKPGASFDNMQRRPIKGTMDWAPYAVVLDASSKAQGIFFGFLLSGKGQIWISDLRFEVVGNDIRPTGQALSTQPGNLNLTR